jgi:small subunit ribosomal protein S6
MPLYESTFIARQDLSKQDVTKLAESFAGIAEQGGGKIVKNEYWGLKSLAYKIEKNRKGHYNMLGIDAPAAAIKEMERNMRINENIVRVLTVSVDELDAAPSVMMNQSRDRSEGYAQEGEIAVDDIAAIHKE